MEEIKEELKWWGIRYQLPHSFVQKIKNNSDIIDALTAAGGSAIVASGGLAAPIVGMIAAYIKVELVLIKRLDKGKGVYLDRPLWTSAILIPSSVT